MTLLAQVSEAAQNMGQPMLSGNTLAWRSQGGDFLPCRGVLPRECLFRDEHILRRPFG
jgi:hypothetical protein